MKYFFLALSVVFLFVACSKNTTPTLSKGDILRSGKWTMTSGTLAFRLPSGLKDTSLNYFTFIPQCHHDDYLTFGSGTDGAIHSNGTVCSPHDPDSVSFQWTLGNNDKDISFFRGFNMIWAFSESVLPFQFDTTQQNPFLVLDTIHGVYDTAFYHYANIELDTIWRMRLDSLYVLNYDIYNASITNFTTTSFTMSYLIPATYLDTTHFHTGRVITSSPADTFDFDPVIRPDTFTYTVTFNKQ